MPSLSHADLSSIVEGDISKVELIDLSNRHLDDIEDLSFCKSLKRIELKSNRLTDLSFVRLNLQLKWIDAQKNLFSGRFGNTLCNLTELSVLNLSHNEISNVDGMYDGLTNLKSLVLSNNQIGTIKGIAKLQNLEALIISNNRLEMFEMPKREMPNLKKLSLGNNNLKIFSLDMNLFNLREIRLNGNKLTDVPANLYCCGQLEILDLGRNCLLPPSNMSHAQYCREKFRRCKKLKSLNLAGNTKLAETPEEWDIIRDEICKDVPTLQIFNSKNFGSTGKSKKRRNEVEGSSNKRMRGVEEKESKDEGKSKDERVHDEERGEHKKRSGDDMNESNAKVKKGENAKVKKGETRKMKKGETEKVESQIAKNEKIKNQKSEHVRNDAHSTQFLDRILTNRDQDEWDD